MDKERGREATPPDGAESVQAALDGARDLLGMDVAIVAELEGRTLRVRAVSGLASEFGVAPGTGMSSRETYSARMMRELVPNVIPDTALEPERPLHSWARGGPVASFIGVPLLDLKGEPFGALSCASLTPKEALSERDVQFLELLARLVAGNLERERLEAGRERLEKQNARLTRTATGVIALLTALDARDRYTGRHSQAVLELAVEVGKELRLPADQLTDVAHVALLHDIGKIGIPDTVLQKPAPLDMDEWNLMRSHSVIGAQIIAAVDSLAHLAPAIRADHERWDGDGYPDGLAGEEIPIASRVVFACDAFHAMLSDRPYRSEMPREAAVAELERGRGSQFCPTSVDALLSLLPRFSWSRRSGVAAA